MSPIQKLQFHFRAILFVTLVAWLAAPCQSQEPIGRISDAQVILKHNVKLACRNSGIVVSVTALPGNTVATSGTIVRLDSDVYEAELGVAQAQLEIAEIEDEDESEIVFANTSSNTSRKILDRSLKAKQEFEKSVSNSEVDKQTIDHAQAQLNLEQAKQKKRTRSKTKAVKENERLLAKLALDFREVRSPIDGLVTEVPVQVGEWVNSGQMIARVIDLKQLRIEAFVPLELAGQLKSNQTADFETKIGSKTIRVSGVVRFVSPEINPVNQDFKIWVDFQNEQMDILPGMVGDLILYGAALN
ncbi:MAG: HlyD family efflux transporter periplasmic adaptor subunit [Planctomycetes bacterium]|nr:HlyD family efflux transporter periplasmic adaptor subunit [Planctomycetota bacterium]